MQYAMTLVLFTELHTQHLSWFMEVVQPRDLTNVLPLIRLFCLITPPVYGELKTDSDSEFYMEYQYAKI